MFDPKELGITNSPGEDISSPNLIIDNGSVVMPMEVIERVILHGDITIYDVHEHFLNRKYN